MGPCLFSQHPLPPSTCYTLTLGTRMSGVQVQRMPEQREISDPGPAPPVPGAHVGWQEYTHILVQGTGRAGESWRSDSWAGLDLAC